MGFDYRTDAGMEKQTLGGHKKNLVCTRTQEKGAVTPQETDPVLPVSVQESLVVAGACMGPVEGGHHYLGLFRIMLRLPHNCTHLTC